MEEGGFTDEYRMYNGERARLLFVWNVDNGSQGAVSPSAGSQNRDGNQPGIHLPWSGMEIWPASLPEFFLEGGLIGLLENTCFGFLAICILFEERVQE